jgi:nitric oxide reductase NorQ protein
VREGGICYLDEVVEARKDTTVVLHPLADDRRILPIDRTGETLEAPPFHAGRLLQPRLPEPAEGPEALHPPALSSRCASTFPVAEREISILIGETGCDADLPSAWSASPRRFVPSRTAIWRKSPGPACWSMPRR